MDTWKKILTVPALAVLSLTAACGGSDGSAAAEPASAVEAPAPAASEEPAVAEAPVAEATAGRVIEIRMSMADGGRFEPAEVTARPGDVLRFVNVENVHNVSFPQGKNAGAANLPASSPFLTTPGQSWELKVELAPGTYTFQCDPHAAMGMVGTLTVAE